MSNKFQVISADEVLDFDIKKNLQLTLEQGQVVDLSGLDIVDLDIQSNTTVAVTLEGGEEITLTLSDLTSSIDDQLGFGLILPPEFYASTFEAEIETLSVSTREPEVSETAPETTKVVQPTLTPVRALIASSVRFFYERLLTSEEAGVVVEEEDVVLIFAAVEPEIDASISLSATATITEADTTIVYTATLDNTANGAVTVSLSNGESITIADGATVGSVSTSIAADEDVQLDESTIDVTIASATGGGFASLTIDPAAATTTITDTIDATTLSLSASSSITEADTAITYTATLTNAANGAVTVSLSNGDNITIADGATSGSVVSSIPADEDVQLGGARSSASV